MGSGVGNIAKLQHHYRAHGPGPGVSRHLPGANTHTHPDTNTHSHADSHALWRPMSHAAADGNTNGRGDANEHADRDEYANEQSNARWRAGDGA